MSRRPGRAGAPAQRGLVLALAICIGLVPSTLHADAVGNNPDDGGDTTFILTILHNNDGESRLLPADVLDETGAVMGSEGGIAHFARVVQRERLRVFLDDIRRRFGGRGDEGTGDRHGAVLVSSGDNYLASPVFAAGRAVGVFYDARAIGMLRYDAIAIGNHEFDFGPEILAEFIAAGRREPRTPPYLSANLDLAGELSLQALFDAGQIARRTVVETAGQRIGIVGATTPSLPYISSPRNVKAGRDVAASVQVQVDGLEGEGVDKIVLISHLQDVRGDIAVIGMLSGVDVVIAGGGDELLVNCATVAECGDVLAPSDNVDEDGDTVPDGIFGPYPIIATDAEGREVPVVTTSGQYGYLGRLVVTFDSGGRVVSTSEDSGPLRVVSRGFVNGVRPVPRFERRVEQPAADFLANLAADVIAHSAVALNGRRAPGVRTMETNAGNLVADALRWQAGQLAAAFAVPVADVALQNGGGIRNDSIIPAGPVSELDTFEMLPFGNFVAVLPSVSRARFREILENAVSRTQAGDMSGGKGRFVHVSGFHFEYSASGTAQVIDPVTGLVTTPGTRVREVTLDDGSEIVAGGIVQPGPDLAVATVDFLARGGDQYPFGETTYTILGVSYQQALSSYIKAPVENGGLAGQIDARRYPEGGEGRVTELP